MAICDSILGMQSLILAVNVILSVILVILVLVQRSNTDSNGAFSADSSVGTYRRRGGELLLYRATIIVAILFAVSLAVHAFLK
jgi:protein translocase SecG subunit